MPSSSFAISAWVVGRRSGHSRRDDHFGLELDTDVEISAPIEKYAAGTTVHDLLADLITRLTAVESGNHRVGTFSIEAFIRLAVNLDAVIRVPRSGSSTLDAVIVGGKTNQPLTLDAVIAAAPSSTFSVSAYLMDRVG